VWPLRNVFYKSSCTEQRREGVAAYLWTPPSFPPGECVECTLGLATEFRSEKIPRNRLGMASVIPRKKVLIPRHSEVCRRVNSEARNGRKWHEKISSAKNPAPANRIDSTKYIYIQSTTVCVPLSELVLSHPLFRQRMCPSPRRGGGGHTRLRVKGWSPNSDDWRKSLALCLICDRQHVFV
jgi:hypothetical protein